MKIEPHQGVDSINFGMSRHAVAAAVAGEAPQRGRRSQYEASDYDFFERLGFFVYYDEADTCIAVEFTRDAKVSYDGFDLFAHPAREVRVWAQSRDPNLDPKDGFNSAVLGLSMYAPLIDEADLSEDEQSDPAQSFLAFPPGYFESERKRISAMKAL